MGYGLQVHQGCHLKHEPTPLYPFNSSVDNHTLGDLHGNALYLLHFLIHHGLARFNDNPPPHGQDLESVGLTKAKQRLRGRPFSHYRLFREIYRKPATFWTTANIALLDRVLARLEIASNAHIRLLGDVLCDRGSNDYLTLKLIQKISQSRPQHFEILLSNHDLEFIHYVEQGGLSRFKFSPNDPANADFHSFLGMIHLLVTQVIHYKKDVEPLYLHYQHHLNVLSYDEGPTGELVVYSHAPINEMDIFRAALCLIDPLNQVLLTDLVSAEDRRFLENERDFKLSDTYDGIYEQDDLIRMINILNAFVQSLKKKNRISLLNELRLTPRFNPVFGTGYTEVSLENSHPFLMLTWGRSDPSHRKLGNRVRSNCSFTNVHGHTWGNFSESHNLNQVFGRPKVTQGSYSVHVSRSAHSPEYTPPPVNWPVRAASAVLFLGIVALVIARVATGNIGCFFALGSFHMAGTLVEGLPHVGVGMMSLCTYLLVKHSVSHNVEIEIEHEYIIDEDGRKIRDRPSFISELWKSCI